MQHSSDCEVNLVEQWLFKSLIPDWQIATVVLFFYFNNSLTQLFLEIYDFTFHFIFNNVYRKFYSGMNERCHFHLSFCFLHKSLNLSPELLSQNWDFAFYFIFVCKIIAIWYSISSLSLLSIRIFINFFV